MRKALLVIVLLSTLFACKKGKETNESSEIIKVERISPVSNEMMETAIIYEANIRQYSKEGAFKAFTKDIPQIKKLGVKVIWLMPVFPISETKRKAKGDLFASDIEDPEDRKKCLGSYYAVSDFRKINPEFGTIEDFRELIKVAHANDMYVILDWVPNHTGWDHIWLTTNPEFYTKNDKGEITDPLNEDGSPVGWADVADLNYDNQQLRETMIKDMTYWVTEEEVDGFRCDVAGSVPTDFWKDAIPKLREKKKLFMLAEAWEPELLKGDLFDMAYGWDTHHVMKKETVEAWDKRMNSVAELYEKDDILMNFITNHDENSWNGTIEERLGKANEAFLALSYVTPGMPLIYSGQEYDLNHRLKFFEKDSIPKTKGKMWPLLEKLGELKNNNSALNGGKNAASYKRLVTKEDTKMLAFERVEEGEKIVFLGNLSDERSEARLDFLENFSDYITGEKIKIQPEKILKFEPWEYHILIAE